MNKFALAIALCFCTLATLFSQTTPNSTNSEFDNNAACKFMPSMLSYSLLSNSMANTDFTAGTVGAMDRDQKVSTIGSELQFIVEDQTIVAGETYTVDFKSTNFQGIIAFQFTLDFDTESLEFVDVINGNLERISKDCFGRHQVDEGSLTAAWFHTYPMDMRDETLFSVQFKAKKQGQLKDLLGFSSKITKAEAYDITGYEMPVNLNFSTPTALDLDSFDVFPNPVTPQSKISLVLNQESKVKILLFNELGQEIKSIYEANLGAGSHHIPLSSMAEYSSGNYLLKCFINDKSEKTLKLMQLK